MNCNSLSRSLACPFRHPRRGAAILTAVLAVFFIGIVALGVELGYLFMNYGQLQTCADSGALAGAQVLMNDGRVKSTPEYSTGQSNARSNSVQFAGYNRVGVDFPVVDPNSSNGSNGDVVIGYLADPADPDCQLDTSDQSKFNAVQVRVRKNSSLNGKVPAFFSRLWGNTGVDVVGKATAVMPASIVGFQVTSETENAGVLPFAIKKTSWDALLAGTGSDDWRYDAAGNVVSGSDGILEMSMFPIDNGASGNSGTVDIGNSNNSTADLSRQIRYGISASDLAYIGGALQLGSDGTLILNGDTGISAAIKDDLESIKGKPRSICIYSTVSGPGNNAMYTIVGFVGIRIMKVKLTGSPKYVTIQPAVCVDASAIIGDAPNSSKYLYSNVRLVR
jgi:Flp pilus assembly protein TadG